MALKYWAILLLFGIFLVSGCVSETEQQTQQASLAPKNCTPNWNCTTWSPCFQASVANYTSGEYESKSIQIRTCNDSSNCGWTAPEQQDCSSFDIKTVYLTREVNNAINAELAKSFTEYSFCLYGDIYMDGVQIKQIFAPAVIEATNEYIQTEGCEYTYDNLYLIGSIHSHPNRFCALSYEDKANWNAVGTSIMAVQCGNSSYSFYRKYADENGIDRYPSLPVKYLD